VAFKSIAQREKMKKLVAEGKLTQEKYDAMAKDTPPDHELAERIHPAKDKK
jgi:hypothetical protein